MSGKKKLTAAQRKDLLAVLKERFHKHMHRHRGLIWADVEKRLADSPAGQWSLQEMERTGGEPDVVGVDPSSGAVVFMDCVRESPAGRRSCCYDKTAREGRKSFPPETSALELATAMDIDILTEADYRMLQQLDEFDLKTSSWVATPDEIRKRGGALFCDRRYGQVFVYHNGADSYYAARGFRGVLRV